MLNAVAAIAAVIKLGRRTIRYYVRLRSAYTINNEQRLGFVQGSHRTRVTFIYKRNNFFFLIYCSTWRQKCQQIRYH